MKNSYVRMKKYRTHPLVKAALAMSWLLTVFAAIGAYLLYLYTVTVAEEYESARAAARYEAYLSAVASLNEASEEAVNMHAAGEAISRYIIFSDGDTASAELLRDQLLSGNISPQIENELTRILDAEREDYDAAVAEAARCAEKMAGNREVTPTSNERSSDGWETLRDRAEVRESFARQTARRFIGGGVTLTQAENHSFPLVYSYTCSNASADITRMGGRLLRMWVYRVGNAEVKDDDACRVSASAFVRDTGITDAVIYAEKIGEGEMSYIFCRSLNCGAEALVDVKASVDVTVARAGARVSFFDAGDYYRYKTRSLTLPEMKIDREKAKQMTGASGTDLMLITDGGELFWRVSGAKNLLLNAKTGEIKVKNP